MKRGRVRRRTKSTEKCCKKIRGARLRDLRTLRTLGRTKMAASNSSMRPRVTTTTQTMRSRYGRISKTKRRRGRRGRRTRPITIMARPELIKANQTTIRIIKAKTPRREDDSSTISWLVETCTFNLPVFLEFKSRGHTVSILHLVIHREFLDRPFNLIN